MTVETFTLPENLEKCRLYPAVCRMLSQMSDRTIREAFERRDVKMNGVRVRRDAEAIPGAVIQIYFSDDCRALSPEIIYEDSHLMVINKPAGISCEADAKGGLTVGEWLYRRLPGRLTSVPAPCHRLDNPTDGLLVLAKDASTLHAVQEAFRTRKVHKKYTCLVKGALSPAEAEIRAYLLKNANDARVTVTQRPLPGSLSIRTGYRVLEAGDVSRVEVTLFTGRTHQIRAQMAYIGHPVLGDDKYGDREFNRLHHARRLMLTATQISFDPDDTLLGLSGKQFNVPTKF